jgi:gluconokinase
LSTRSSTADSFIVSLDAGSSSVRALLFDSSARPVEGYGARLPYRVDTTPGGGVEIDPVNLAELAIDCLDELHRQVHADGLKIAAIGGSAFWHSFLGVGENGRPTLPILHLLDTRSAAEVAELPDAHARTGCVPHTSYWPSKLLWLAKHKSKEFAATRRWLSFPEFLFEKLFGHARLSTSMASATGLWDQNANDYDAEMLAAVHVDRAMLADPGEMDRPACGLLPEYRAMWPAYEGIPWFPALGDGACDNVGSGAIGNDRFSLMVGTTGAMRVIIQAPHIDIAPGLWCYRLDRKRFVTGGALSNGGEVYAWMKRTLQVPKDLEARLEAATPGTHGLTLLPFFSGERSPYWRSDLRAAITGMSLNTDSFDILRASLESVALRFRQIYAILSNHIGSPAEVIASGGALLHSPAWTQMMADALGRPIIACTEPEASCRGAALWVLEQLGAIENIDSIPASTGATFNPRPEFEPTYDRLLSEQHALYDRLYAPALTASGSGITMKT